MEDEPMHEGVDLVSQVEDALNNPTDLKVTQELVGDEVILTWKDMMIGKVSVSDGQVRLTSSDGELHDIGNMAELRGAVIEEREKHRVHPIFGKKPSA